MAQANSMTAEIRERAGKGAARATRRAGRVPAVIYGNKQPPMLISLDPVELKQQVRRLSFFTRIFELKVKDDTHRVLAREIQLDPVTDHPVHVDFMRFSATTRLNVEVKVNFINMELCPGLKAGGVLNVVRRTVELICAAESIPESITADIAGLGIGSSLHISDIKLPEGVRPAIADRDFTIATIAAPTVLPTAEEEAAEKEGAADEKAEGEAAPEGE
ncbi:MAG: 50S ribosomal protein L25/general stress protein Ctc [Rhodospirillales bacterium RIFCSPLOWO2_12_FULL_58_28]|nr:MAG: 50S ribosomal protein L25/general stress protein Ctc [Rhodospirillales bacterium RIFCSPLOWO2_02_FULL_58_16]OHC77116.1 MAG: 50S ribosomal protein L25/general stress protein Ctc [Rhodospirillales bacterium RIFCSPLOWO2_12_FULL_58_28]